MPTQPYDLLPGLQVSEARPDPRQLEPVMAQVRREMLQNLFKRHPSSEGMTEESASGIARTKALDKLSKLLPCQRPCVGDLRPGSLRIRTDLFRARRNLEAPVGTKCAIKVGYAGPFLGAKRVRIPQTLLQVAQGPGLCPHDMIQNLDRRPRSRSRTEAQAVWRPPAEFRESLDTLSFQFC